jgi:hypothetical protein
MAPDVENTATACNCKKVSLTPTFVPQTQILEKSTTLRNPRAHVRDLLATNKNFQQGIRFAL